MHQGNKFLHYPGLVLVLFIIEKYLAQCIRPGKLVVDQIFKGREALYQHVTDKRGAKLRGGGHIGGGLLLQLQDDSGAKAGKAAEMFPAGARIIARRQHDKRQGGKGVKWN